VTAPVNITYDNKGARVTSNGELVVGTLDYSEPYYVELGVDNQVYNIVPAVSAKRFIMVGILLGADRNVTTDTSIQIYEATAADTTAVNASRSILTIDLNKGEHTYLNLINVATDGVKYINGVCDDDDVDVTIFGYYVQTNGD